MGLFQSTILLKYLKGNEDKIVAAYQQYVDYFHNPNIQKNIRNSKEEQFQEGFLRELFVKIFGYTLNPSPNFNLITEKKNENDSKKADGAILINGEVKAVIELKDLRTTDLKQVESQAFGYKNNHRKASYVITSNYEKLRFYIENTIEFEEFNLFSLSQEKFAELWICLAYENIAKDLPKQLKNESTSNEDQITKKLYKEYAAFKDALFDDMISNNKNINELVLFKKSQKLLDRCLFIFFAEDCGLLPPNSIAEIIEQWETLKELDEYKPLYDRLKKFFGYMNTGHKGKKHDIFAYNGGLFSPDELLDNLTISDDVLSPHLQKISRYNFSSEVDVNILGHIFEHSLAETEGVIAALGMSSSDEDNTSTSKRKRDGVFYTPRYITTYIVENTLGKLCADKKAELSIDESEYHADSKRQKATKLKLEQKLLDYRNWLLSLTICDPACGSGAFLNAALDFLMAEHRLINEMRAKIFDGVFQMFDNIENAILENNLYGVDINEESVEIAKLALWLRTAKPNRKLNSLNNNIKCGNSLISDPNVAGEKAFDWNKEFPHVFEKGGFDVVIGNPPYGASFSSNEKGFIRNSYRSYKYKFESYIYFIEKSLSLIKDNGFLEFITPTLWLELDMAYPIRSIVLNNYDLQTIRIFGDNVFNDAVVNTCSFRIQDKANANSLCIVIQDKNYTVDKTAYIEPTTLQVSYRVSPSEKVIIDKIQRLSTTLSRLGEVVQGITPYDKYRGQSEEIIKSKAYHFDYKYDEFCGYWLDGKDVSRYFKSWGGKWLRYGEWLAAPREKRFFEGVRILFREIPGEGKRIQAIIEEDSSFYGHSITPFKPFKEFENDVYFFLGVVNSKLLSWYGGLLLPNFGKNIFPKLNPQDILLLPIPLLEEDEKVAIGEYARKMMAMSSELQVKRQRFLRRLSDNFTNLKITGMLERFDELEFKQFLGELAKQKISLSLKQQDEWEEYFNEYKRECAALVNQINSTDKEIDGMVYGLYGLTEEEIEINQK